MQDLCLCLVIRLCSPFHYKSDRNKLKFCMCVVHTWTTDDHDQGNDDDNDDDDGRNNGNIGDSHNWSWRVVIRGQVMHVTSAHELKKVRSSRLRSEGILDVCRETKRESVTHGIRWNSHATHKYTRVSLCKCEYYLICAVHRRSCRKKMPISLCSPLSDSLSTSQTNRR